MHLLNAKLVNTDKVLKEAYNYAMLSHKFEINVPEVFGENFTTPDLHTWLNDKPIETFDWLRLPFGQAYFEFTNSTLTLKRESFGMFIMEDCGILVITPFILTKNRVQAIPVLIRVGIAGELPPSAFTSYAHYADWLTFDWNTTRRVDVRGSVENSEVLQVASVCVSAVTVLLESLLYINAKGVGTTTNKPPISDKIRRKRKGAKTDWTFKTLRLIKKGDSDDIENKTRKHIPFISREAREHSVRGHIAVYTKEKPLFGNPKLVGPVWISPHVRNRGTEGKIVKDYEVV